MLDIIVQMPADKDETKQQHKEAQERAQRRDGTVRAKASFNKRSAVQIFHRLSYLVNMPVWRKVMFLYLT